MKFLLLLLIPIAVWSQEPVIPRDPDGRIKRSQTEVRKFKKENICPLTGQYSQKCSGYVVDHIWPLCDGGPDKVHNMQYQTVSEAKEKDKWERQQCAARRKQNVGISK